MPSHPARIVEVDDVAALREALQGCELIVVERRTFYGATETIVRGPAGQVVTFAQFSPSEGDAGGQGGG